MGDVVTADSADYAGRRECSAHAADDLFQGSAVERSAEDLAASGVFDDGELEEFLADLASMRQADPARTATPRLGRNAHTPRGNLTSYVRS